MQNANEQRGGKNMYDNLQAEQARRKMTNQDVANYLGISRNTYEQKKRSGRFIPSECIKLCELFDCAFEYLFETDQKTERTA